MHVFEGKRDRETNKKQNIYFSVDLNTIQFFFLHSDNCFTSVHIFMTKREEKKIEFCND